MKNNNLILAVVAVLVFGGGYIYSKNQKQMSQPPTQVKESQSLPQKMSKKIQEITMTAKQWEFMPSEVKVKEGETVRLKVKSVDVAHGFSLPDFSVDERLEPGKEITVEFVANKKGTFTFFCSVLCGKGHRDMKGTLIVE
ncbi:cupredoxin domain-containing protein [Candidatus Roizmanbacteria bacterium]|nr:cupredoxin domain-containing protein [Candidatus Roizmanbacteria bacterium]